MSNAFSITQGRLTSLSDGSRFADLFGTNTPRSAPSNTASPTTNSAPGIFNFTFSGGGQGTAGTQTVRPGTGSQTFNFTINGVPAQPQTAPLAPNPAPVSPGQPVAEAPTTTLPTGTPGAAPVDGPTQVPGGAATEDAGSISGTLRADPDYEAFTAALDATGQTDFLNGESGLTVLAPTDDAFRILANDTLRLNTDGLSDAEVGELVVDTLGQSAATELLRYHVSAELQTFDQLIGTPTSLGAATFTPLAGQPIPVQGGIFSDGDPDEVDPIFVGFSGFGTDVQTSNGLVHGIDRVLLPNDIDGGGASRGQFSPIFIRPVF